jgi:hypothetical protein
MNSIRAITMHKGDSVATLIAVVDAGIVVDILTPSLEIVDSVIAQQNILFGHKIAIQDVARGAAVTKYGEVIGTALQNIHKGDHVHVHNLVSNRIPDAIVWYRERD